MLRRRKTDPDRHAKRTTARLRRMAADNPLAEADARDVQKRIRSMVYGNGSRES